MPKLFVQVRAQFEGYHKWDKAPLEVAFLRNLHRHMFHIRLKVQVAHDDRDIEFIIMKRRLEEFLSKYTRRDIGSCEMLAQDIYDWVKVDQELMDRLVEVEVSEDGENSGICTDL